MSELSRDKYGYEGPEEFRPVTAWGYVGYTLLYLIPFVGWIFLLVFTFSRKNIPRRCFARSFWCWLALVIIDVLLLVLALAALPFLIPGGAEYLNLLASWLDLMAAAVRMQ